MFSGEVKNLILPSNIAGWLSTGLHVLLFYRTQIAAQSWEQDKMQFFELQEGQHEWVTAANPWDWGRLIYLYSTHMEGSLPPVWVMINDKMSTVIN